MKCQLLYTITATAPSTNRPLRRLGARFEIRILLCSPGGNQFDPACLRDGVQFFRVLRPVRTFCCVCPLFGPPFFFCIFPVRVLLILSELYTWIIRIDIKSFTIMADRSIVFVVAFLFIAGPSHDYFARAMDTLKDSSVRLECTDKCVAQVKTTSH